MKDGRIMLVGPHRRFAIEAAEGLFQIRDAETISDADVRARVRPHVVAQLGSLNEALSWCRDRGKDEAT